MAIKISDEFQSGTAKGILANAKEIEYNPSETGTSAVTTVTVVINNLKKEVVEKIEGATNTYTFRADGQYKQADPIIRAGEILYSIEGEGVERISFSLDMSSIDARVTLADLPYTFTKDYPYYIAYVDETHPDCTFKVRSSQGLIGDIQGLQEEIEEIPPEIQEIKTTLNGSGEVSYRTYTLRADGVYHPLEPIIKAGDVLDSIEGTTFITFSLDGEERDVRVEPGDLPYTFTKDYPYCISFVDIIPRPSYTFKVRSGGSQGLIGDVQALQSDVQELQEDIQDIQSEMQEIPTEIQEIKTILNGSGEVPDRTYIFRADGQYKQADPIIKAGEILYSIEGEGINRVSFSQDGTSPDLRVTLGDLPYTFTKDYPYYIAYVDETHPNCTFKVRSGGSQGLIGDVQALQSDVQDIQEEIQEISNDMPKSFLPNKIYGVINDTFQLFIRGIVISQNPYRFSADFKCIQGKVYDRYFEMTPQKDNGVIPQNVKITHRIISDSFDTSSQIVSDLVLADRPTSFQGNINVLCVGASTTQNGEWASELKRRLCGTRDSGTPAADGLTGINFVGRIGLAANSTTRPVDINVEATGGWRWKTFYTPQEAVRMTVSGISSVNIGDVYQYQNASSKQVKVSVAEVNVTGDSGNIRFIYNYDTVGKGVPVSVSGTITKVSGSGDNSIIYSSATLETYCPFINTETQQPGFIDYARTYCNNKIDVVIFYLGSTNEGIVGINSPKITSTLNDAKTLLDALHTDFPNCKVIVCGSIGCNIHHGADYNYGANSELKQWPVLSGMFGYVQALEELLLTDEYKTWCYFANTMAEVDAENVFPTSTKPVNTRMSKEETYGTNGVHPTLQGYQMIADSIYRCFVNVALQ